MSVTIFEVSPATGLESKFIYTIDTSNGDILPFSATTLRLVDIPSNAEFKPIKGSLAIKATPTGMSISLKKGSPYIVVTPDGPSIAWWIDGRFNLNSPVSDHYLLKIPKYLIVEPHATSLEAVPISYPEVPEPKVDVSHTKPVPPQPQYLDQPGSPENRGGTVDLGDRIEFLTALFEAYLRREYKMYPVANVERLPLGNQNIPVIKFNDFQEMLARGEVSKFEMNPLFQPFAGSPRTANRMYTVHTTNGGVYIVAASYDPASNKFGPLAVA